MLILGIGSFLEHDPAAALLADGRVVAAAEEERFSRRKHARRELPVRAAAYCLNEAGVSGADVDLVAVPWSEAAYYRHLWRFVRRTWRTKPSHAVKAVTKARARNVEKRRWVAETLRSVGIDPAGVEIAWVEHHIAHASSAFHLSGFHEAAILTLDGKGEFTATLSARGRPDGRIEVVDEVLNPDSLGLFYATLTQFLGFEAHDGEFKVMGMAAYGDAARAPDLAPLLAIDPATGDYRVNDDLVWVRRAKRYEGRRFSRALVDLLGCPPREGDEIDQPYIHIAAAAQRRLEEAALALLETRLARDLERHGSLCLAGGCALNVRMNQRLLAHPLVRRVFVQPAAHDAGTALGAATAAAVARGERVEPMAHAYLGPAFAPDACRRALEAAGLAFREPPDLVDAVARLLAAGEVVAWFQGRLEWGPRALGARSILAHPGRPGTADRINADVKLRERWRPFCPSVLAERAAEVLGSAHPAPFMTLSFDVPSSWRDRIGETVHVDGTARPQVVDAATSPLYHRLIARFEQLTGLPAVLNTSFNRRGEPVVCTPEDALATFLGSGLRLLAIGPYLVDRRIDGGADAR